MPHAPATLLRPDPERHVAERHATLVAQLRQFPDPQQRFLALMEIARQRPFLPDTDKVEAHRVPGCLVRIWLVCEFREGRCRFRLDSDAATLKAVAGILCDLYDGGSPSEILAVPAQFLEDFRLTTQLAESRRRTVWRIRDQIHDFALACQDPGAP